MWGVRLNSDNVDSELRSKNIVNGLESDAVLDKAVEQEDVERYLEMYRLIFWEFFEFA